MPPVSKNPVDKVVLMKLYSLFFDVIKESKNKTEFDILLQAILSSTEKTMIAKRIAIYYLLLKKIDYRNICETLKVSAATVFKFRSILENNISVSKGFLKLIRNEKIIDFIEGLYLTFHQPGTYGVDWSSAWKAKRDYENKKEAGI